MNLGNIKKNIEKSKERSSSLNEMLYGYAIPRQKDKTNLKNKELIQIYLEKYGLDFIKYIKGNFIIHIKDDNNYQHIYTDRIGIKKLFYWQSGNDFIISDNIKDIIQEVKPSISALNLALHSLFHHFVDGRTMYKGVYYSKPASHFIISPEGMLSIEQYWDYGKLLTLPKKDINYADFADILKNITATYLQLSKGENVTMTLTGGMDSRIVLGALLANNIKPYTFTFGNENSADVNCAKKIAKAFNITYNNYNFPNPSAEWYKSLSQEIAAKGNTLVHIHRSHRLDAMKREKKTHPKTDTIFLGAMGGEGIRGLHYDDLISTSFVRRYYENKEDLRKLITEYCITYFHKMDVINIDKLYQIVSNLPYIKNDYYTNQYYFLYELVASLHDTQDISLYYTQYKNVICPFLDIDYLEMLFSSKYHLLKKKGTSHKISDRLTIPQFHCNVSSLICNDLDKFQYSNGFSPKEYLMGKYPYLFIRGVRKYFKKKYPPNFPYQEWFYAFIEEGLDNVKNIRDINSLLNILQASELSSNSKHDFREGFWHKYSNIIMYNLFIKNING